VQQVDSSLLDEWSELAHPSEHDEHAIAPPPPPSVLSNPRAFRILVRNALFRRVQLAALDDHVALGELDADSGWNADR
ncbi:MAG TPA: DUF3516 domain-containing protein, partial [Terrimesophilobacter sp.]|nr:DUF3516 domain-containing protein [Terrimesophilobacter sp.]